MYYAKYTEADREVMAFKTKAERDDWTRFKDEISIVCGTTADNATFQRTPLTMSEAATIVGRKNLFDKNSREEHEILKGVFVILAFSFHSSWAAAICRLYSFIWVWLNEMPLNCFN